MPGAVNFFFNHIWTFCLFVASCIILNNPNVATTPCK